MTGGRPSWFGGLDQRTARAVWSRLAEPGDHEAAALVQRSGALEALAAVVDGAPGVAQRWRVRLESADPRRDLDTLSRVGGRLVVPGEEEWPTVLDDLDLRRPFCLWVRGLPLASLSAGAVAVVGARAATPYGERIATELGAGCTERGHPVVSGAAFGIDAAAHRGALGVGGPTVAVLACGVDRPYPRGHSGLIEQIAEQGAVVSEVPPGSSPTRWRFVERNRLIAALAQVTVVVEAGLRSGAAITAREATDLGRSVAAVPGPVTSPGSAGCHRLLRDGAVCVTDAAEVVELLAPVGEQLVLPHPVRREEHDGLPPGDSRIYDALPLGRGAGVASIARTAGLDLPSTTAALGRLEVLALAVREHGGWRRARRPPGH